MELWNHRTLKNIPLTLPLKRDRLFKGGNEEALTLLLRRDRLFKGE
jgi:hypothetical protein